MTVMETDAADPATLLSSIGFKSHRGGLFTMNGGSPEVVLWCAATIYKKEWTLSFGYVLPKLNRFALEQYKKATSINAGGEYSRSTSPPVLIETHIEHASIDDPLVVEAVNTFISRGSIASDKEVIAKAEEYCPYGASQRILLPAYYAQNGFDGKFRFYIEQLDNFLHQSGGSLSEYDIKYYNALASTFGSLGH
jgi:hypothetical protein